DERADRERLPRKAGSPVNATKPSLQKIPVYEVRLVQARRPLRLAETVLTNSSTSARALHALIALTDREHFAALFVNAQHQVTGAHIVAIGAQHSIASVDLRALFRAALAACSCAVVLGHNHPSGDPGPSPEDIATTKHIMIAGKILCIPVLDHLIVTRNPHRYHSMFERGTLPTVPE
ncbi:MAG: JAB domain-containing protein, partial [Gemmatimonadales bacterium]